MTFFERDFAAPEGVWADHPGVRHLFEKWVLPGSDSGKHGLRIGLRKSYLNLYVKGQSVAKLRISKGEPVAEVHPVYSCGLVKGAARPPDLPARYERVYGESLAPSAIDRWISTAETYASAEKRFVDDLIAGNAGVIDLEMGLPAEPGERAAPRVDLVVVQTGAEIAFWEAKCSNNAELRAVAGYQEDELGNYLAGVHVIQQLRNYQRWMTAERQSRVAAAYRSAGDLLDRLAERFGKHAEARTLWRSLADAGASRLVMPPAIVVGNYCPADHAGKIARDGTSEFEHLATSFAPFRKTIERHGVRVHEVDSGRRAELPRLFPGTVTATRA